MNGKQLKNSILQWAIQGKLVPQDPNDEPASVLLDKIRKEKERLIKEKKIKRDKNASVIFRGEDNSYYEKFTATGVVKCIDEEIPFEIPQGWEWMRMQNVITFVNGRAYKKEELLSHGKYKVLRVGNFFTNNQWYYSDLELSEEKYCENGDLLYAWSASFGPKIWNGDKTIFHYHIWNVKFDRKLLYREFLYYFFLFDKTQVSASTTGSTMIHVSMENMKPRFIPIPPLNEQKRIVEKIDLLLPLIEKYDSLHGKKITLDNDILHTLKKSTLQEAIQGGLVPQYAEEGTAETLLEQIKEEKLQLVKEGKLKKSALKDSVIFKGDDNKYWEKVNGDLICIDDEIPFDLPQTWCWCRLRSISSIKGGKRIPVGEKLTVQDTGHKYIRVADMKNHTVKDTDIHYISDSVYAQIKAYTISCNDLYITVAGTIGCVGEIPEAFNNANLTENADKIVICNTNKKYLMYCLLSNFVQSQIKNSTTKVGQPKLAIIRIENLLIPLPPLEEQQRIVNKVNELTSYCCPVNFRF